MNASKVGMGRFVSMISLMLLARMAAADESFVLVKVSDMDRSVANQVMSSSAFKDFEKTIQNERKYFPDALRLATKAWKDDQSNKNAAFPAGRIAPRALVGSPEHFATQAKADEQLNKYQEREAQKEAREKDKMKGKAAKPKEEVDKEKKKAAETTQAADLVKAKLADLMAGKSGDAAPEAGAGEKKAVEKKAEPRKPAKK